SFFFVFYETLFFFTLSLHDALPIFVIIDLVFIIIGLLGLGYTYWDFTATSHKYMNANFHWGGYLVWIGWFVTCVYFLFFGFKPKEKITSQTIDEIPTADTATSENYFDDTDSKSTL